MLVGARRQCTAGAIRGAAGLGCAHVNLSVAVFIWVTIFPMRVGVDFAAARRVGERSRGLLITLVIRWLIKPFTMAALMLLFFGPPWAEWLGHPQAPSNVAGMILRGAAPCTAWVHVWSRLTCGRAQPHSGAAGGRRG